MNTPPNFRRAVCCGTCAHMDEILDPDGVEPPAFHCSAYSVYIGRTGVCDNHMPAYVVTIAEIRSLFDGE